jgi:hypothetical protein
LPATGTAALKASIPASRTSFVHKPRMPTHQQQVHTVLTGALPFFEIRFCWTYGKSAVLSSVSASRIEKVSPN